MSREGMEDSLHWRPERPCREEVVNVLRFLRDSLEAANLPHVAEQDEDQPNLWVLACADATGHENVGLLNWREDLQRITYAAYRPEMERRDMAEGIDESESKCWWSPQTAEQMAMHLSGRVREIMERYRVEAVAALDREVDGGQEAA